jgi:HSP20 family protein
MCHRKAFYHPGAQASLEAFKRSRHGRGRKFWKDQFRASMQNPPANVLEENDQYLLHLYAPGFSKEDFLIATIDNTLSISLEVSEDHTAWKRQEYSPQSFKRQFDLSEKIKKDAISAKYEDGVLIVTLPKLEGMETSRQEIQIA